MRHVVRLGTSRLEEPYRAVDGHWAARPWTESPSMLFPLCISQRMDAVYPVNPSTRVLRLIPLTRLLCARPCADHGQ